MFDSCALLLSGLVQPLFSSSVLFDLMRPDGSSAISVMGGETMTAELAHEIMGLQVYLSFYQPVSI